MKKIDVKKTLDERVRNTEWTDANTWNVLRKIRNTKSLRAEFSLRRLAPAAVALVLLLAIGVTTLTRTPGRPDPIRDNAQYTVQPTVTAMAAGQGEGTGDLPEGEGTEKNYLEAFREYYPEVADQLMPVNSSCEKDGIRLEMVSGLVKDYESWMIYSVQDVEGKYTGSELRANCLFQVSDAAYGGEMPFLYADEKEHKYYFCDHTTYDEPVSKSDRIIAVNMYNFDVNRVVKLDLAQLLEEHGTESEGVLSPERLPWITAEGPVTPPKVKILDYSQPQLDIPVIGDVVLTGIGWVDGKIHVQFHNSQTHPIAGERSYSDNNWTVSLDYDDDYWKEDLYDTAAWNEDGSEAREWEEIILNCDREYLEKMNAQVEVTFTDALVEGNWEVMIPLRTVCADTEYRMNKYEELRQSNPEVYEAVDGFLRSWYREDFSDMYFYSDDEWKSNVYMGWSRLRSLAASGSIVNYNFDSVSGEFDDAERTAVCTIEMEIPGEKEPVYRRYEILARKNQESGMYTVDPTSFSHWETVESDQLDRESFLRDTSGLADGIYYGDEGLLPLDLSCEKQGIDLVVAAGIVKGQSAKIVYSLKDMEGKYATFPDEPVLDNDIGSISGNDRSCLRRNEKKHSASYMQYIAFDQPVTPEDRTVTLKIDSVKVSEKDQADLTPMLKQYAKATEGVEPPQIARAIVEHRYIGPTKVPDLKVLDYSKPLDISLFGNTMLSNIGWIDGKLHVQIHTASPSLGGFAELWLNTSLDGNTDTLWKELDYSPVEWYDDDGSWYEFVYDYAPEDLNKLEMTINAIYEAKTLTDDWTVSFPLSKILGENETTGYTDDEQVIREKMNEMYPGVGDELVTIDQAVDAHGIRVKLVSALVKGKETQAVYTVQDLENKYAGLNVEPVYYFDSACPEDCQSNGLLSMEKVEPMMSDETLDDDAHISMHSIICTHTQPVQDPDREITLGLRDLKFVRHTTVDMHPYIQEYAKPQEGKTTRAYGAERKILDTAERLSIPLGRDDVLLTGIGWIDNQLHVRVEYTGGNSLQKNAISDGQACNVWISGGYIDPEEHPELRVDYSMLMGPANSVPWQFEEILDCGPDDVDKLDLIANIDVVEDSLVGDWSFNVPLSKVLEGNETAEYTDDEQVKEEIRESKEEPDIDSILKELRPVGNMIEEPGKARLEVIAGLVKDDECWLEYSLQAAEGKYPYFDHSARWFAYLYTGNYRNQFVLDSIQDPIRLDMNVETGMATYLGRYKCYYPYEDVKLEDLYLSTGISDLQFYQPYHTDLKPILQEYGKTEEGIISRDHAVHVGVPEEIKVLDTSEPLHIPLGLEDAVLTGIGWIDGQLHIQIKDEGSKKARDEYEAFHCPSFDLQVIARDKDTGKIVNVETEYSPVAWLDSDYCKDRYEVILNCGPEDMDRLSLEAYIFVPMRSGFIYLPVELPMNMISDHEIPVYYDDFYYDMMAKSVEVSMELGKDKLSGPETIDVKIGVTNVCGKKLEESVTLYDPDGNVIEEFGRKGLDAGETREWSGKWTVTEEQLKDEAITFFVEYSDYADREENFIKHKLSFSKAISKEEAPAQETTPAQKAAAPSPVRNAWTGKPVRVEMELGKEKFSGPETIGVTIKLTNVSGGKLLGPVTLYDPAGKQIEQYGEEDFAADETKEWSGDWTVTEDQIAEGKVTFSIRYTGYRNDTDEIMSHKLNFSKEIRKE